VNDDNEYCTREPDSGIAFPGVKQPEHVSHSPLSRAEVNEVWP
jgi:hypothetical protein